MAANDEPPGDVDLDRGSYVGIRQAFYEGLSRSCLNAAWSRARGLRSESATFLGESLRKRGVSQMKIATAIDRNPGEICRWLQGKSPEWANLMIVMLVLDANWGDLRDLPTKAERRRGGCSRALLHIRREILGDTSDQLRPPKPNVLRCLEALFDHEQWAIGRRNAARRNQLLAEVATKRRLDHSVLDAADHAWGTAFHIFNHAYLQSIDVRIWRSPER